MKYETSPSYRVTYASTTYGTIYADEFYIAFGINKHGKVVMWLGDIGTLPEQEQYYLRSENVESDHSIGSEFYEGQIDCVYTEPSREDRLFALRSDFVDACFKRFGVKIAHLDNEVLDLARAFNSPIVDTEKERRHVADSLNKVYIESFDNKILASLMKNAGGDPTKLGSLKRLQATLESVASGADIPALLSPLYVLYDFRVAYSHLTSAENSKQVLKMVTDRLDLNEGVGLIPLYERLTERLMASLEKLTQAVSSTTPAASSAP